MLDLFHIRPWEYNPDREVYKEDLANMINLKKLQREADTYNIKKEQWRNQVQGRIASGGGVASGETREWGAT